MPGATGFLSLLLPLPMAVCVGAGLGGTHSLTMPTHLNLNTSSATSPSMTSLELPTGPVAPNRSHRRNPPALWPEQRWCHREQRRASSVSATCS